MTVTVTTTVMTTTVTAVKTTLVATMAMAIRGATFGGRIDAIEAVFVSNSDGVCTPVHLSLAVRDCATCHQCGRHRQAERVVLKG